jgi:transposase-like protein
MARAFSDDLRCRILRAYEPGKVSLRELAERFGVNWEYARKIRKQHLHYGQMERVKQSRHVPVSRVTPEVQQMIRNQVRAHPDLTLWELQRQLVGAGKSDPSPSSGVFGRKRCDHEHDPPLWPGSTGRNGAGRHSRRPLAKPHSARSADHPRATGSYEPSSSQPTGMSSWLIWNRYCVPSCSLDKWSSWTTWPHIKSKACVP